MTNTIGSAVCVGGIAAVQYLHPSPWIAIPAVLILGSAFGYFITRARRKGRWN